MIESVRETGGRIERGTRFLHYAGGVVDGRARAARPRSLGGSERFALEDGYGFPRRRLPRPQGPRSRRLHADKAKGEQADAKRRRRERFHASQA